jgi:hypothetical protein
MGFSPTIGNNRRTPAAEAQHSVRPPVAQLKSGPSTKLSSRRDAGATVANDQPVLARYFLIATATPSRTGRMVVSNSGDL